jgi:hypothetical protein
MEQPAHRAGPAKDLGSRAWLAVAAVLSIVGASIFYSHAKLVGGAAEEHIAWQAGYGFVIGLLVVSMADAMDFEYRKFNRDGSRTFWRFARTWKGLTIFVVELLLLGFAICVISFPNDFADTSHF